MSHEGSSDAFIWSVSDGASIDSGPAQERGRKGDTCVSCQRLHRKCDGARPSCDRCQRQAKPCQYPPPTLVAAPTTKDTQKQRRVSISEASKKAHAQAAMRMMAVILPPSLTSALPAPDPAATAAAESRIFPFPVATVHEEQGRSRIPRIAWEPGAAETHESLLHVLNEMFDYRATCLASAATSPASDWIATILQTHDLISTPSMEMEPLLLSLTSQQSDFLWQTLYDDICRRTGFSLEQLVASIPGSWFVSRHSHHSSIFACTADLPTWSDVLHVSPGFLGWTLASLQTMRCGLFQILHSSQLARFCSHGLRSAHAFIRSQDVVERNNCFAHVSTFENMSLLRSDGAFATLEIEHYVLFSRIRTPLLCCFRISSPS